VALSPYLYWLETLRPFAERGFTFGVLDTDAVYLSNGRSVERIARGGWTTPSLTMTFGSDDAQELSVEDSEALHALMRVDVADVSQPMTDFLSR
jgi:hypothetical protein